MQLVVSADDVVRAGEAAERAGDFVGAAAAFGSLVDHEDSRVAAGARFHLGRVLWKQGQLAAALSLCQEAREMALKLEDRDLRAQIENAMGVLHFARGEYEQARAAYGVAADLTADIVTRAKITLNLGVIANVQGHFDVARRQYAQSEALFRSANDERGVALALHNVGMLHADRAEWDEAEEAFQRALTLFEDQGNRQMIANVLLNRSEVRYGQGRPYEAIAHCDLAISIYAEIGDEVGRGEAMRWRGHGFRVLGRFKLAADALMEATRIAERTHTRLLEAESLRELGLVRLDAGNPEESKTLLEQSLEIFTQLGAEREIQELQERLGR